MTERVNTGTATLIARKKCTMQRSNSGGDDLGEMAKSVRASVSKRNSAKLRATVFGPADNARTARLSAKLQELASQPKPTDNEMKVDDTDEQSKPAETEKPETSEDMDIDRGTGQSTKSRSKKPGRIQKRHTKNSIVFAKNPYGVKQASKKRK